jgi:hypothetical protein
MAFVTLESNVMVEPSARRVLVTPVTNPKAPPVLVAEVMTILFNRFFLRSIALNYSFRGLRWNLIDLVTFLGSKFFVGAMVLDFLNI